MKNSSINNVVRLSDLIKEVAPRTIWQHESRDFSAWLAKPENLAVLSDVVGLNLQSAAREVRVGKFRTDILITDIDSGNKVIIENQLETSNHDHLGKCVTYMAGHQAKYCIWICKEALTEHRSTIELLNKSTDSDYRFYLVELKTYSVGTQIAYDFVTVVEPYYEEKYRQNSLDGKNPQVVWLNNFWEDFGERLPPYIQDHLHIQYSGKAYVNLTFENQPFWMCTKFSKQKKTASVCIIAKLEDVYPKLEKIFQSEAFRKSSGYELRHEQGSRNANWHIFQVDENYDKELDDNILNWMIDNTIKLYNSVKDIDLNL